MALGNLLEPPAEDEGLEPPAEEEGLEPAVEGLDIKGLSRPVYTKITALPEGAG